MNYVAAAELTVDIFRSGRRGPSFVLVGHVAVNAQRRLDLRVAEKLLGVLDVDACAFDEKKESEIGFPVSLLFYFSLFASMSARINALM